MKKLLSSILAAAVACSSALCLTTVASAAEDNGYALSVAFDKNEVGKGEDLTMTIKLEENPGLVSIRFQVKYNPEAVIIEKTADITSLEDFGTPGSFTTPKANNETGTVTLRWSCPLSEENITVTGDIATIKFTVNSDSPIGSTGISIEPIEINMIDEETLDFIDLNDKYGTDVTGYFKTPSYTDGYVALMTKETDIEAAKLYSDKVIELNTNVHQAYLIQSLYDFSKGSMLSAIENREKAISLSPYTLSSYTEYMEMLEVGITLYEQAGDNGSAEFCRKKLISIPECFDKVIERTSTLGWLINDLPPELSEEHRSIAEGYKTN